MVSFENSAVRSFESFSYIFSCKKLVKITLEDIFELTYWHLLLVKSSCKCLLGYDFSVKSYPTRWVSTTFFTHPAPFLPIQHFFFTHPASSTSCLPIPYKREAARGPNLSSAALILAMPPSKPCPMNQSDPSL